MEINYLAIFFSVFINLFKRYLSKISAFFVTKFFSFQTSEINELIAELVKLQRERNAYNPVDEFAKYALCDRRVNKLADTIKEKKSNLSTDKMKKIMYFNAFFIALMVLMSVTFIWYNYNSPIIDFQDMAQENGQSASIFFPFNSFLSFPNVNQKNSIGVTAWIFFLNRLIDISVNKCGSLFGKGEKAKVN